MEELQAEIDVLNANRSFQDEKLQITYNYGLNIVKRIRLHEEIVKEKTWLYNFKRKRKVAKKRQRGYVEDLDLSNFFILMLFCSVSYC